MHSSAGSLEKITMNDKIAIIGIVGVPANYGGFETLVDNLIEEKGEKFHIYCSSFSYKEKTKSHKKSHLHYIPLRANGFQSILYDIASIIHAIATGCQTFLILGVSGALAFKIIKTIYPDAKVITNIDGLEWQRQKWNTPTKKLLKYFEKLAVKNSTHVVCDNKVILDYVKNKYKKTGVLIPYGGDHAIKSSQNKITKIEISNYCLSICRIEPENNIHTILQAFKKSNKAIIFIGNWNASTYGKHLYQEFSSSQNIRLLNPIYDNEILFNYRANCSIYIHGHSAGGTNPSLVEMMHFGKLIIAFDCAYNRSTMMNEGLYFKNSQELESILHAPNEDKTTGEKLKQIAIENYCWEKIRAQYLQLLE